MFLFLSKILPLLIYPAGLATLLLLAALLLRKRPRWRTGLTVAALLVIWLAGNRFVAMAAAGTLEARHPSLAAGSRGDVILVLGGSTREQSPPRPINELNEAGDRLLYAATLYHAGAAPRILVTGGSSLYLGPAGSSEAGVMASQLQEMGVPGEAILLETESHNTRENAVNSQPILEQEGMEEILLVTSAMHMPRSVAIFNKLGIEVMPAPTDYLVTEADWRFYSELSFERQIFNLIPSSEDLWLTSLAMKERIGMVVYRLRGWV
jgi:uncharacterized SAM-binding protein YcdF (DUF218 family)